MVTPNLEKQVEENPFDGWISIGEAAELSGFNITTVAYWADQGYVKSHPVGLRMRVVNVTEVLAYAAQRKQTRKFSKPRKKKLDMLPKKE